MSINPQPQFELSLYLYMQFMEPLGTTDSSVEASWDHQKDQWKPGLIDVTRELAPGMMGWGGNLSAYYKWREGVGPRKSRIPFLNTDWGGIETNQIGTAEFVDFSRPVGADSLMCVNFESDGLPRYAVNGKGEKRSGDSQEAAAWVDYCNNPSNKERISHGFKEPLRIGHWQIGNETSYRPNGFDNATAARKTVEFAKAMRGVDPSIKLIGWRSVWSRSSPRKTIKKIWIRIPSSCWIWTWPSWVKALSYISNILRRSGRSTQSILISFTGRKKVLQHFLSMDRIFKTEAFHTRYEAQARENLKAELSML